MGNRCPAAHLPVSVVDAGGGQRKATRTSWKTMAARLPQEAALLPRDSRRNYSTKPLQTHSKPAHSTTKRANVGNRGPSSRASAMRRRAAPRSPRQPPARRLLARPLPLWPLRGAGPCVIGRVSRANPRTRLDQGSHKAKRRLGERRDQKWTAIGAGRKLYRFVNYWYLDSLEIYASNSTHPVHQEESGKFRPEVL